MLARSVVPQLSPLALALAKRTEPLTATLRRAASNSVVPARFLATSTSCSATLHPSIQHQEQNEHKHREQHQHSRHEYQYDHKDRYLTHRRWTTWVLPSIVFVGAFAAADYYTQLVDAEKQKLELEYPDQAAAAVQTDPWQVTLLKKFPTKILSRAWGTVHFMELPVWMREPCYKLYARLFNCNLDEMENKDLTSYPNLSAFFMRSLVPGARPIDKNSLMTSPADGKVLHFGAVDDDRIEQVKGVTYSLKTFLGETPKTVAANSSGHSSPKDKKKLFHIVIYLAPGDYHRFHSPVDWTAQKRHHFPGELFSVAPAVAEMIAGLFSYNERVVLLGSWKHGFFSYSAVGAYNVGSILINMDKDLVTNQKGKYAKRTVFTRTLPSIKVAKGDEIGTFNLGSTLVLIFEAPANFEFSVQQGQKVRVGQPLGDVRK